MQYKDYYSVLKVEEKASHDAIKKAYRQLAKKYHPDGHQGNQQMAEKFKEINEAYEVLGDPEKRKKYDYIRGQSSTVHGDAFDPSQFGYQFSQGSKKQSTETTSGFSDFFNAFFGNDINNGYGFDSFFSTSPFHSYESARASGVDRSARAVPDVTATLQLTLVEAYHGVEKTISLVHGSGEKTLQVKVPAGVLSGEKLKLKGQGGYSDDSIHQSDLFLQIEIKETETYKLDGLNIHQKVPVTVWEAALGNDIIINSLSGPLRFTLPPNTSSGKMFRFKGKGFKSRKGKTGDLLVMVEVQLPATLSEEEREHYLALKEISAFRPRG